MTLEQVRAEVERLTGESIPPSTLRRWACEELIPSPNKIPGGPRGGTTGDWPNDTVAQVVATRAALRVKTKMIRPTREAIKEARKIALEYRVNPRIHDSYCVRDKAADGSEGYLMGGILQPLIVTWGVTMEKVLNNKPLDKPSQVSYVWHPIDGEPVYQGIRIEDSAVDTLGTLFERPDKN